MKTKKTFLVVLALMVTLLTGCIGGSSSTGTTKTDEKLAKNQVKKLLEGYRELDATAMGEVMAPIITFTGEGANDPYSREEFVTGFQAMFDESGLFSEDWIPPIYGPLKAVAVSNNIVIRVDVVNPGDGWENIWTFTLIKSSGEWLITEWNTKVTETPSE